MSTFAEKIITFYRDISYNGLLPEGISIMNPFRDDPQIMEIISVFYRKFYSDNRKRHLILGINPGRFGAGATGIPFTDTVRLEQTCDIRLSGFKTYETSSVFIHDMIHQYGGHVKFFSDYYISSVSPLGFTADGKKGGVVNYNYYDNKELTACIMDFILDSLRQQLGFGIFRDICFCLGTGKNFKFIVDLNYHYHFFDRIESLEHPRYIMQYKLKKKQYYMDLYISKLKINIF